MSEESTRELPDRGSFERRVFARFDSIDTRLEKLESRNYDTKPIWERALTAITEMGLEVSDIKAKLGAVEGKIGVIEGKVQTIENEISVIKTDQRTVRNELIDVRRELKHHIGDRVDMILKFLIEDREDIRDAEGRIRELESKLA